jgi:phospholipid/cholesterol/gamma-HCH transport system substrate-binding protein
LRRLNETTAIRDYCLLFFRLGKGQRPIAKRLQQYNKTMRSIKLIIILGLFASSCNSDHELTIVFPNADGLMENSKVLLNGLEVGKVRHLKVGHTNDIEAIITLDKGVKISKDSKFILTRNLFGAGTINVSMGTNNEYLTSGEKISGQLESIDKQDNRDIEGLINRFITGQTNRDSFLIELRRLNNNLERLMNKSE